MSSLRRAFLILLGYTYISCSWLVWKEKKNCLFWLKVISIDDIFDKVITIYYLLMVVAYFKMHGFSFNYDCCHLENKFPPVWLNFYGLISMFNALDSYSYFGSSICISLLFWFLTEEKLQNNSWICTLLVSLVPAVKFCR
jgi:hypothetical protein